MSLTRQIVSVDDTRTPDNNISCLGHWSYKAQYDVETVPSDATCNIEYKVYDLFGEEDTKLTTIDENGALTPTESVYHKLACPNIVTVRAIDSLTGVTSENNDTIMVTGDPQFKVSIVSAANSESKVQPEELSSVDARIKLEAFKDELDILDITEIKVVAENYDNDELASWSLAKGADNTEWQGMSMEMDGPNGGVAELIVVSICGTTAHSLAGLHHVNIEITTPFDTVKLTSTDF